MKPHTAVNLFGAILMLEVYGCTRFSACYDSTTQQYLIGDRYGDDASRRQYELNQHNPNCK